ncbi:MAG: universal stress protein [Actinobacteria bacterium]|nr:universal stress protein [Actinomycetota bacterium]
MTKVLIAADSSESSLAAARGAVALFGDTAEYLVVNVDRALNDAMAWGAAYPMALPLPSPGEDAAALERAEEIATEVADAAVPDAEVIGDTGDPATAIINAAHEHAVDVIVVGSHSHSWFSRLFTGSVSSDVIREADIPVLVMK